MAKLDVKALGLALGILWGGCMFFIGLAAMACGWGGGLVKGLSSLYVGFNATFPGSIIGALWGFVDAGIGGVILAWLYNRLAR